jgi:aspartate aminotransferase
MAGRIIRMRRELFQALQDVGAPGNWAPVMDAIGMFAMLGLTKVGAASRVQGF